MGWQDDPVITGKPKWESDPIVSAGPMPATSQGVPIIEIKKDAAVPALIAPSANPFSAGRYSLGRVYTVGDEYTHRESDLLTGIEERIHRMRVTKVDYDEDRVEFNHGRIITDLMGNSLRTGSAEFDTPVQLTPAEFQIGKKWTAAYHQTKRERGTNISYDMTIVKRETITVPAGSFDTFRIEGTGWNMTFGKHREVVMWLVPGLICPIKTETINRDRKGRFKQALRSELTAVRQQVFDPNCVAPAGDGQRKLDANRHCAT